MSEMPDAGNVVYLSSYSRSTSPLLPSATRGKQAASAPNLGHLREVTWAVLTAHRDRHGSLRGVFPERLLRHVEDAVRDAVEGVSSFYYDATRHSIVFYTQSASGDTYIHGFFVSPTWLE